MKRVQVVSYFVRLVAIIILHNTMTAVFCDQKKVPVHYPNRVIFKNDTKSFTVRVTRFICTETPYEVSELLQCKTVLRRNKPTFFNFTVHVPMVLNTVNFQVKTYYRLNNYQGFPINLNTEVCGYLRNPSDDIFSRHLMSIMFETIPHLMYYCPHGNTTYTVSYWLEDKFFPKSMPAGDYRQDVWFRTEQNKTLFSYQVYFSVRRMGIWRSLIEW
ncbi:uncharacterized protein LOC128299398 [Anopheles moucheti]|uniref:uncharacterized protein LOC128299398 n=1 Tax=Anopheles moucheti TaxID=186751 RepID=UPI0022F1384D|nr:uncharacterized protein LOC128299398 [Anopheles moucheti]